MTSWRSRAFAPRAFAPRAFAPRAFAAPILALLAAACSGGGPIGEASQAIHPGEDDPGDHGAGEPWVECPARRRQAGADPLGPVIAHGYLEAPGYQPTLLDEPQRIFLHAAKLRTRDDDGVNTVLYEGLTFPNNAPSGAEIARWVEGAVRIAGKRLPGAVELGRTAQTPTDDGAGHALPPFSIHDLVFKHDGAVIAGAGCSLVTITDHTQPATLSCRIPRGTAPLTFERFERDKRDAEEIALAAAEGTRIAASSRRYLVSGDSAAARFVIVVDDGKRDLQVILDGLGSVLDISKMDRLITYDKFVDLDYSNGPPGSHESPLDVGEGQLGRLDTAPYFDDYHSFISDSCDGKTPAGFVVCENPLATHNVPVGPSGDQYLQSELAPRPPSQDFTSVERKEVTVAGGTAPGFKLGASDQAEWLDNGGDYGNAAVHWAELQMFHSAGRQQRAYEVYLGHPSYCSDVSCPSGDKPYCCVNQLPEKGPTQTLEGQAPYRLKLTVHGDTIGETTLSYLKLGDPRPPGESSSVEGVADGTLFAHEYNHYILASIEADDANGWQPKLGGGSCPVVERDVMHEGLADAFASLFTDRDVLLHSMIPLSTVSSCANPSAYPDNPLPLQDPNNLCSPVNVLKYPRNACNSVVYGYWGPGTSEICGFPSCAFEPHRRGSVVFGALFAFQKRFKDGGFGWAVPGLYMYDAQKQLKMPTDDERVYLDALITSVSAKAQGKRHQQHAQVAFAEKNVFPTGGGQGCTVAKCSLDQAVKLLQKSMAVSGPLSFNTSGGGTPEFKIFMPQGDRYDPTIMIELSDNPDFSGTVTTMSLQQTTSPPNNAPAGFKTFKVTSSAWSTVVAAAQQHSLPKVYYRMRQCLANSGPCLYSTPNGAAAGTVPYVTLGVTAYACIYGPPAAPGAGALAALGLLAAFGARRRARRQAPAKRG